MSVEKVNAYREKKVNRKEELIKAKKQQATKKVITRLVGGVLVVAVVAALGLTGWNEYQDYKGRIPNYDRTEMVVSDVTGILTEETVAE